MEFSLISYSILTKDSQQPYLEQIFLLLNIGTKWKVEIDFHVQYFKPSPMGKDFFSFLFFNANVRCYVTLKNFFSCWTKKNPYSLNMRAVKDSWDLLTGSAWVALVNYWVDIYIYIAIATVLYKHVKIQIAQNGGMIYFE